MSGGDSECKVWRRSSLGGQLSPVTGGVFPPVAAHCKRSGRRGPGDRPFLMEWSSPSLVLWLCLAEVVVTAVEGSLLKPHWEVVPSADSRSFPVRRERTEVPR